MNSVFAYWLESLKRWKMSQQSLIQLKSELLIHPCFSDLSVERIVYNEPQLNIIGVQDFSLPNFSKHVQAYNAEQEELPITSFVKSYTNQKTAALSQPVQVIFFLAYDELSLSLRMFC